MKLSMSTFTSLSTTDLSTKLKDLKTDLFSVRQQLNLGTLKGNEIKIARKNVARCLTALREKRLIEACEKYKDAKILPKDMRMKMTKKMRNQLTRNQERKRVWKVQGREMKYKKKYYAYSEEEIRSC